MFDEVEGIFGSGHGLLEILFQHLPGRIKEKP
jgi:hypothetical protein